MTVPLVYVRHHERMLARGARYVRVNLSKGSVKEKSATRRSRSFRLADIGSGGFAYPVVTDCVVPAREELQ